MSIIEYFIIQINKAVLFLFHSLLLGLQFIPPAPVLIFSSLCNLTCGDLVRLFPSHDCKVPKCLWRLESESLEIFCQFMHFLH